MKIKKEIVMTQKEYDMLKKLEVIFENSPMYDDCSFGDFIYSIVEGSCTENYGYDLIIE